MDSFSPAQDAACNRLPRAVRIVNPQSQHESGCKFLQSPDLVGWRSHNEAPLIEDLEERPIPFGRRQCAQ